MLQGKRPPRTALPLSGLGAALAGHLDSSLRALPIITPVGIPPGMAHVSRVAKILRDVNGPVLVICNHIGDVDSGFVLTALPARLRHKLAIATGGEALEVLRTPPASSKLHVWSL